MFELLNLQDQPSIALSEINESTFEEIALHLFNYQYKNNLLYRTYADNIKRNPKEVSGILDIPFLPISFFKSHTVKSGSWNSEVEFISSGTTGAVTSRHLLPNMNFYLQNSISCFEYFFGPIGNYHFLALLPSYLERSGSSLVAMMEYFIRQDISGHSGFYLHNESDLVAKLESLKDSPRKTMLWGVSFALLDLAEKRSLDLSHCIVMETGGMKGRRKELTREEVHKFLCRGFNMKNICSEYGMTELLSQAYAEQSGYFNCPPWMKAYIRGINDPFEHVGNGRVGAINIIDLANVHSCAFIETEDLGRMRLDGSFEVIGRMDNSDIRGCNLLVGG